MQRSPNGQAPKVILLIMVTIVPTRRGVSSPAPLLLCPEGIIPRMGRTGISIMLILGQRFFSSLQFKAHESSLFNYYMQLEIWGDDWRSGHGQNVEWNTCFGIQGGHRVKNSKIAALDIGVHNPINDRGELAVSYRWTGWSSRLHENYRSF